MRVLVVFNHPYEKSYCAAVLKSLEKGLTGSGVSYEIINLDKDGFNPVMTANDLKGYAAGIVADEKALEYQEKINNADHLVFIFPIWWELMPAMMKGFLDKVITKKFAYDTDETGLLPKMMAKLSHIKGVTLITTMNTPTFLYKYYFASPIQKAFFRGTFRKIGIKNLKWINLAPIKMAGLEKREKWLDDVEKYAMCLNKELF